MSKIKFITTYRYRALHIIISMVLISIMLYMSSDIAEIKISTFNKLAYYGTFATFIGLIIAIFEILHASKVNKSIEAQVTDAALELKNAHNAIVDSINSSIKQYEAITNSISYSDAYQIVQSICDKLTAHDYSHALSEMRAFELVSKSNENIFNYEFENKRMVDIETLLSKLTFKGYSKLNHIPPRTMSPIISFTYSYKQELLTLSSKEIANAKPKTN